MIPERFKAGIFSFLIVGREFANGPGDRVSIPGKIIPKT